MQLPAVLGLVAASSLSASVVVGAVDFTLWGKYRKHEARVWAFRRHRQPLHLSNTPEHGDPVTCRDTTHLHDPRDFEVRFRARRGATVRAGVIALGVVIGALATIGAGIMALVHYVMGIPMV